MFNFYDPQWAKVGRQGFEESFAEGVEGLKGLGVERDTHEGLRTRVECFCLWVAKEGMCGHTCGLFEAGALSVL